MLYATLNSGQQIPRLGLGVYKVEQDIADTLMVKAIETGYRRIDTAAFYDNELEIGSGIRKSGVPREEIFVTTKLWKDDQGKANTADGIEASLDRLKLGYVDMLLIHWPHPSMDLYCETWEVFNDYLATGRVKGIGVSNFEPEHLDKLLATTDVVPAINQVELNPSFQQAKVRAYDSEHGIMTEAWSPIARGRDNQHPVVVAIAAKHGKTAAQVIIRWHIQLGNLVIPKTVNPDRLLENISVFDFELDDADMAAIATMDTGVRSGLDPNGW
ncbi:MAG: aldo/keto reductase [Actinomycetales bacterium]|nr:aldo/keto reductase [Actinomycetales bacterium]